MSEEEFITKFYSCDNEEQFLKDVHHNLNCLQQENSQLKERIEKAIEYIGSREMYNDDFDTNTNKLLEILKGDKE